MQKICHALFKLHGGIMHPNICGDPFIANICWIQMFIKIIVNIGASIEAY